MRLMNNHPIIQLRNKKLLKLKGGDKELFFKAQSMPIAS